MPKQGKSPKKKTKEKSPQRTGESEYPEMDQDTFNRLFQNAIEQSKAELQQRHEEQLKAVEERLTKRHDDEVRGFSQWADWVDTSSSGSASSGRSRPGGVERETY